MCGQSRYGSCSNFGEKTCQQKCPSISSTQRTTPPSPVCFESRGSSLFVPIITRPCDTTGVAKDWVPIGIDHLMFLPVAGSHDTGKPVSSETMLREWYSPHCG